MSCNSCEVLKINGVRCHERGCPDAWQDYERECGWCGSAFLPEESHQKCCDESCAAAYYGYPLPQEQEEDPDYDFVYEANKNGDFSF